jgi:hypothetical protein
VIDSENREQKKLCALLKDSIVRAKTIRERFLNTPPMTWQLLGFTDMGEIMTFFQGLPAGDWTDKEMKSLIERAKALQSKYPNHISPLRKKLDWI